MNATDPDVQHELRIKECYDRWMDGEETAWPEFVRLINERSAEQIEKMERAQGLQ